MHVIKTFLAFATSSLVTIVGCGAGDSEPGTDSAAPVPVAAGDDSAVKPWPHNFDTITTIEGVLAGSWIRQGSGGILGDYSKATISEPMVIEYNSRSLPIFAGREDLEGTLVEWSGKRVRLKGRFHREVADGRGHQHPQAGSPGPIPDHVVEFFTVIECEEITPEQE